MRTAPPIALLCFAACLRTAPEPQLVHPVTARLDTGMTVYQIVEHRRVTQEFQGQPLVSESRMQTVLRLTLSAADSAFGVDATVESVAVDGDAGLPAEAAPRARGVHITARAMADGRLLDISPEPDDNPAINRLVMQLPRLLVRTPPHGAAPMTAWRDTLETRGRSAGIPIVIRTRTSHQAGDWTESRGHPVLPVTSHTEYDVAGEGERDGQWISLTGRGRRVTQHLLTPTGRVAEAVAHDTLEANLSLPSRGLVIPVIQTSVDSVRVEEN